MPQKNAPLTPSQMTPSPKTTARAHVMPEQIPAPVALVLRQTLKPDSILNAFKWLVSRIPETPDATELADHLAERYEQQIVRIKDGALKQYLQVFRVGFAARCLEILPLYSMKMAEQGYNPVFLRIYFQKRLVANLIGISITDVERRIRASNAKTADYLTDQIHNLYPECCVARELKQK